MEHQSETKYVYQGARMDCQQSVQTNELIGRRHIIKKPSTRLKDHVTYTTTVSLYYSSPLHSKSLSACYPIAHFVICDIFLYNIILSWHVL